LAAAFFATVGGGSAYGVLVVFYAGLSPPVFCAKTFAWLTVAVVVGAVWSLLFVTAGILAGGLWTWFRGIDDAWTGVICGGVTGFCALAPVVNWSGGPPSSWYVCLIPALVGGIYGGFGAAMQRAAEDRRLRLFAASNRPVR
jgi:hypothetical protein